MLTTVHLKGMVLLGVKPLTAWKLDIILGTDQPLNQLCHHIKSPDGKVIRQIMRFGRI